MISSARTDREALESIVNLKKEGNSSILNVERNKSPSDTCLAIGDWISQLCRVMHCKTISSTWQGCKYRVPNLPHFVISINSSVLWVTLRKTLWSIAYSTCEFDSEIWPLLVVDLEDVQMLWKHCPFFLGKDVAVSLFLRAFVVCLLAMWIIKLAIDHPLRQMIVTVSVCCGGGGPEEKRPRYGYLVRSSNTFRLSHDRFVVPRTCNMRLLCKFEVRAFHRYDSPLLGGDICPSLAAP